MIRTKRIPRREGPADAILVSDIHLSETTPISRTDDYINAQFEKLTFLQSLRRANHCSPVLCSGDIFDKWKNSPGFCSWAYLNLPMGMTVIPGQHDLPHHSHELYSKSSLALLETVGQQINVLHYGDSWATSFVSNKLEITGVPFGLLEGFKPPEQLDKNRKRVLLLHELVWEGRKPPWATNSYSAQEIIDLFGDSFDLIVTGDNHQSFVVRRGKTLLVNPGSMMRMDADQEDFKPKCYLYYADDNTVVPVEFPIKSGVHNRDHLDRERERDERIAAYIKRSSENWELGLSFRGNLEAFFTKNNIPRKVREVLWQHMEGKNH